ncbi:MAG TPA: hypothetical protein VFB66_31510 [Tepidisphaeraceae bacterium]|nr:hypothetical protein [Tepidisphaeraceae bacterium]
MPGPAGALTHHPPQQLLNVRLTGAPKAATGMVLTFAGPLDPTLAADVNLFRVVGKGKVHEYLSQYGLAERVRGHRFVRLVSAAYDEATRTVTLLPARPFNVERYLRGVAVDPRLCSGVSGQEFLWLHDVPNVVLQLRELQAGRSTRYVDGDRSVVRLRLSGPGKLVLLPRRDGSFDRNWQDDPWEVRTVRFGDGMQLWVEGATPDSVLTGTVSPGTRGGDGSTSLAFIVNPGGARIELLNDPAFQVGSVLTGTGAA